MSSFEHDSPELAAQYDRLSNSQFESSKRLVERLGIGPGMHVLDVGSGTGRLARWLADKVGPSGSVVGIEPLPERVDLARKQTPQSNVTYRVGQAEALGEGEFDAVCMSAVLHWIEDKARALGEVHRVLRPGGRLGVTTLPQDLSHAGSIGRILGPLLTSERYAGKVNPSALTFVAKRATVSDLIGLVLGANLHLQELHIVKRATPHGSGVEMLDFLEASSFGNFTQLVTDDMRATFRADLMRAFDTLREGDKIVNHDWGCLFIASRKP